MGTYSKVIVHLLVTIAGAVPILLTFHTWQQIVSYLAPMILAAFGVYAMPNYPKGENLP